MNFAKDNDLVVSEACELVIHHPHPAQQEKTR
jgi:hypothetical protein